MGIFHLVLLAFSILLVHGEFVSPILKHKVSYKDLVEKVPHIKEADFSSRIFELHENKFQLQNSTFHVLDDTVETNRYVSPSDQVVVINGVQQDFVAPMVVVRKGSGYTVLLSESGRVDFLTADKLHLIAVDHEKTPGLYINSYVSHRIARQNDKRPNKVSNGSDTRAQSSDGDATGVNCERGNPGREVEVAVASDYGTCQLYGGSEESTTRKLTFLMNKASEKYERISCLSIKVVYMEIHCSDSTDPYKAVRTGDEHVDIFAELWNSKPEYRRVRRDIATFITPSYEASNFGVAFPIMNCQNSPYNWNAALPGDDVETYLTIAHEIGHNLNLNHVANGIMFAGGLGFDADFSNASKKSLLAFLRTRSARCLTSSSGTSTPRGETCPSSARATNCIQSFKKVGQIPLRDGESASVSIKIVGGRFKIRLEAADYYVLGTVSVVAEYAKGGGMHVEESTGDSFITLTIPERRLRIPGGKGSCCGNKLRMTFYVGAVDTFFSEPVSFERTKVVSTRIKCKNCGGGDVKPMGGGRKCPVCL